MKKGRGKNQVDDGENTIMMQKVGGFSHMLL